MLSRLAVGVRVDGDDETQRNLNLNLNLNSNLSCGGYRYNLPHRPHCSV